MTNVTNARIEHATDNILFFYVVNWCYYIERDIDVAAFAGTDANKCSVHLR